MASINLYIYTFVATATATVSAAAYIDNNILKGDQGLWSINFQPTNNLKVFF